MNRIGTRSMAALGMLALLVGLAGCGDDDEGATTTTTGAGETTTTVATTATTGAGTSSSTATDGIDTMPGADTEPKSGEPSGPGTALLTAVRTGRHEGFDRVTFEFDGPTPGYDVQYVEPPILADGSGEVVNVEGASFLQVRFEPASGYDLEHDTQIYTGPTVVDGDGTSVLVQVTRSGDFEAVLTWVAGLEEKVDFRVTTLSDPSRVVVDVRNH